MRALRMVIIFVVIIMFLALLGVLIKRAFLTKDDKPLQSEEKVITVEKRDLISTISATGIVQPKTKVEIIAPKRGRIDKVLVEEGNKIEKNRILALMSSEERVALLDTARVNLEEAKKSKKRKRIRAATKELTLAQNTYKQIPIISPIEGTIIFKGVKPNQYVSHDKVLFILSDVLVIVAQVNEADIGMVKLGQPLRITTDAFPDRVFNGNVDKIAFESKTIDDITYYDIITDPKITDNLLKSGMTANIEIIIEEKRDALCLPIYAIQYFEEGQFVIVENENNNYNIVKIETGINDGQYIEIINGLFEGQKVLLKQIDKKEESKQNRSPFSVKDLKFYRKKK